MLCRSAVKADVERVIMPGMTHWQHPNFFAFFPAMSSFPAQLGDMLSGALNPIGFNWLNSPACTELETVVLDWTARLLGLPEAFTHSGSSGRGGGVIQCTASDAVLVAMVAARAGCASAAGFTVYASDQTHSSVQKATMILGCRYVAVPTDDSGSVLPASLAEAIERDLAAGFHPGMVVATLGTTSTCAFDDLPAVCAVARPRGLWVHVDAAYAGSALSCEEHRWFARGVEDADSFNFNCHKWLLVNFDLSCFWVRDRKRLTDALSITPAYLKNAQSDSGLVLDYRDWQVPLGRRFRSLKLWFVLRLYGVSGVQAMIRKHCSLAKRFADHVAGDPKFEIAAPQQLSLVCFRVRGASNDETKELAQRINKAGKIFLITSEFKGKALIRFVPVAETVHEDHIDKAWEHIRSLA